MVSVGVSKLRFTDFISLIRGKDQRRLLSRCPNVAAATVSEMRDVSNPLSSPKQRSFTPSARDCPTSEEWLRRLLHRIRGNHTTRPQRERQQDLGHHPAAFKPTQHRTEAACV
jgi:hypothetical protein